MGSANFIISFSHISQTRGSLYSETCTNKGSRGRALQTELKTCCDS